MAPHLNNNGPVSAPQLLGAIRLAMDADDRDRTLFDTTDRESTKVVDRTPHVGESAGRPNHRSGHGPSTGEATTANARSE